MWVTHQAHVTIRYYKVCVCVWPYLLKKSINDLQKHSFASFCSSCENCAHCFASFPKPSELTSPSPFFY